MKLAVTVAKQKKIFLALGILTSVFVATPFLGISQPLACPPNIDWEFGDFTGWTGAYGGPGTGANAGCITGTAPFPGGIPQTATQFSNVGFVTGRHTIMDPSMGVDQYGGFPVVAPTGGGFSLKLGDNNTNNSAEKVSFRFVVPPTANTYAIRFLYAVVLQNPNHSPESQPRFTLTVRDSATNLPFRDGCSDLNFVAATGIPGFFNSTVGVGVQYKPWTEHLLNLSGAAGRTVFLDLVTTDCSFGGHFGYGYFDVQGCEEYQLTLVGDSCNLDRGGVSFSGPPGFKDYDWYDGNWQWVDSGRYVSILPPSPTPQVYKLILTPFPSVSLCPDTLYTLPFANININKIDTNCLEPNTAVQLDANIYGGSGPLSYQWSELVPLSTLSCTNCQVPVVNSPQSNQYTIKVTDTVGCIKSEVMTIGVNENVVRTLDDFVQCRPGYMQLDANTSGLAPVLPVSCGASSTPVCATPSIITVGTQYREQFGSKEDTSSLNNPFATQYTSEHMQFILRKEDMRAASMRHGTITSLGLEVKNPNGASLNTFSISLACTDQTSLGGAFIPNPTLVYTAPGAFAPTAGWNDFTFDQPYDWNMEEDLVVDICMTNSTVGTPPVVIVVNTGSTDALIGFTTTNNGNVCATGNTNGMVQYPGRPSTRLGYCRGADAPFEYTWSPGQFLQDTTVKSPLAFINRSVTYYVKTIGGSECLVSDSVNIIVPIHDYDITPHDTSICYGDKFSLVASGSFATVRWYEYDSLNNSFITTESLSCDGCPDPNSFASPIAAPKKHTTYVGIYTDEYGCSDTLFSRVVVRPLPPVQIINKETTIKYGTSIQLLVSGAYYYTWWPISTLTHPNIVNPWASPTEPTMYYVHGIGENGCRNIDSVKINIDYRDNLFVPSAFTPNGDGKNDVFRVANITFQKLQEFRIFNRWGQEIYSTNDPLKGWDGSWKGVPQDMGAYQYLIRVAYPDGFVETYKGNVTLVR